MAYEDVTNPQFDRITQILQSRAPAPSPYQKKQATQAAIYGALGGESNTTQQVLESIMAPQRQQREGELKEAVTMYDLFEQKRMSGDKQAQEMYSKASMITSDPAAQAKIIQMAIDDPEVVNANNALPKMVNYAKILGIRTDYQKAQDAPRLPEGVKLPEGTMPVFENGGFSGIKQIPGIELLTPKVDEKTVSSEGNLRKEFTNLTKDFHDIKQSYNRIQSSVSEPSAAGDLALIFNYMKMLDPGSTVREGEFATAQNSGSVPNQVMAMYNKIISGERLTESQRADFLNTANRLYNGQAELYNQSADQYRDLAKQYGFDPERIARLQEQGSGNGAIPENAELIGTSGGKKVYKLPNGSHVMEE